MCLIFKVFKVLNFPYFLRFTITLWLACGALQWGCDRGFDKGRYGRFGGGCIFAEVEKGDGGFIGLGCGV